MTHKRHFKFR